MGEPIGVVTGARNGPTVEAFHPRHELGVIDLAGKSRLVAVQVRAMNVGRIGVPKALRGIALGIDREKLAAAKSRLAALFRAPAQKAHLEG